MIQSLWSDYGELVRLQFENKSVIVKHIKLPKSSLHPRGWNTDLSHKRKLHSYKVEVNWYQSFSKLQDEYCRIPQGLKCFEQNDEWLIVMEDLAESGYDSTTLDADESHIRSCLSWLANFHAKYLGSKSDLLWKVGTYWHLDTRPDELKMLKDMKLKNYAEQLNTLLNNTKYQTIVHGDAKLANFCFNSEGTLCAAVDFQYVGHGCGMKDVVYFMSSCIDPKNCTQAEQWFLDIYFENLRQALQRYHPDLEIYEIEKEWRAMFTVAWADFLRFIKGWSPEHYKINSYSEEMTKRALDYLNSL